MVRQLPGLGMIVAGTGWCRSGRPCVGEAGCLVMLDGDEAVVFADLAVRLHEEPTVQDTVQRVVQSALSAVGCRHAGVLLVHGRNRIESAAVTDPVAAKADRLQLAAGEGPVWPRSPRTTATASTTPPWIGGDRAGRRWWPSSGCAAC